MKKFFNKIVSFLKMLFGINLSTWMHDNVTPSIEFIEQLKKALDSKFADVMVAILPGDWDDKLKAWFSENLGNVLNVLAVTNDIASEPDLTNKILKLIEYLKAASPAMRSAVYKQLASELAKASNNGKDTIKGHAVDLLVQMQYSKLKEGLEADDLTDYVQPTVATVDPSEEQIEASAN